MLWSLRWEWTRDRLSPLKVWGRPERATSMASLSLLHNHLQFIISSSCHVALLLRSTVDRFWVLGIWKPFLELLTCIYDEKKKNRSKHNRGQTISHFMSSLSAPLRFPAPPLLQPLISTHSLVFYHTFLHLKFTNPIYCYLYPWLLLSLLLLSLLLWLELLSSCALFSIFYKV